LPDVEPYKEAGVLVHAFFHFNLTAALIAGNIFYTVACSSGLFSTPTEMVSFFTLIMEILIALLHPP
jgi:hypothetical protein